MVGRKRKILIKKDIILAIESSCDDTSIAITKKNKLLSNVTLSSLNEHKKYGGIVPELAARSHCSNIDKAFNLALKKANVIINDIDYIAYTNEPGLIGSLHIGKIFANHLAFLIKKPIIKVNHMFGHIFSYFIDHDPKKIKFPILTLIVSGGHTFIARLTNLNDIEYLNCTIDNAVGEVLDKIGRYLNLDYPGGISIDKIYDSSKIIELCPNKSPKAPFSFSGFRTFIVNKINQFKMKNKKDFTISIASSSLEWIVDDLCRKLIFWLKKYPDTKMVLVGGGVSANKLLKKKLLSFKKYKIYFPTLKFSNDNAAMIALYAWLKIQNKI